MTYPQICYRRRLDALAVELWTLVFEIEPTLLETNPWYLQSAAKSAILAGCEQGKDQPQLDASERAKLRARALTWLRAALAIHLKDRETGTPTDAARTLRRWRGELELSEIREPAALAKLPEAERKSWEAFWAEVADATKL